MTDLCSRSEMKPRHEFPPLPSAIVIPIELAWAAQRVVMAMLERDRNAPEAFRVSESGDTCTITFEYGQRVGEDTDGSLQEGYGTASVAASAGSPPVGRERDTLPSPHPTPAREAAWPTTVFPATVAVTLRKTNPANPAEETLEVFFLPEEVEEDGPVAIYELKSVGVVTREFREQSA